MTTINKRKIRVFIAKHHINIKVVLLGLATIFIYAYAGYQDTECIKLGLC